MRGGQRVGSGRKRGEESVRIRVPVGCLDAVNTMIASYKKNVPEIKGTEGQDLKSGHEIKEVSSVVLDVVGEVELGQSVTLNSGQEIKEPGLKSKKTGPEIKRGLTDDQKAVMRELERLPKAVLKQIRAKHGTLAQAVLDGVRPSGKEAYLDPRLAV
jgi:hypothetical protein